MEGVVTELQNVAEWTGRVEETFRTFRYADQAAQERACQSVRERDGEEAGKKLRDLFEAERDRMVANSIPRTDPAIRVAPVEKKIDPQAKSWRERLGPR